MNERLPVTNPDATVTAESRFAGAWRRIAGWPTHRALLIFWTLGVLAQTLVNTASVMSDLNSRGIDFRPAEPAIWEMSSALALIVCLLPVLWADDALRARTGSPVLRLLLRLPLSLAFSASHVVLMVALRHLVYALAGWQYHFGPWLERFVYEYRKDALTFVLLLGAAAAWRVWIARPPALQAVAASPASSAMAAPTFLVRTPRGDLLVRADDIDWIEAQGNYVGLHVQGQMHLLRQTLAETETRLTGHGFIRTHRRALVNRARMQAIIPSDLGEPGVRLSSGVVAPLSESRRAEVLRLVLGSQ